MHKNFRHAAEPFSGCSDQWALEQNLTQPQPRRMTMSRKLTLTFVLATAATIAAATLGSTTADARGGFGGGFSGGRMGGGFGGARMGDHRGNGGRTLTPILGRGRGDNPRSPRDPGHHPGNPGRWTFHPHGHLVFRYGRWITIDDGVDGVDAAPVAPVAPVAGPCTCLTKTYTQDGLVVFADVCTKEAASARVDGGPAAATPVPPADKSSDATGGQSAATNAPTSQNYAGRTYQDFLAANGLPSQANLKN
jgi:hypothetical protein